MIWTFLQDQILGMKWLNSAIGSLLSALGLDISSRLGGSLQFFLYDVIKITILLCALIFLISYIQSYFPPERSKDHRPLPRPWGQLYRRSSGHCYPLLLLFLHPPVHGFHQRWSAAGRHLLLSDLLPHG